MTSDLPLAIVNLSKSNNAQGKGRTISSAAEPRQPDDAKGARTETEIDVNGGAAGRLHCTLPDWGFTLYSILRSDARVRESARNKSRNLTADI